MSSRKRPLGAVAPEQEAARSPRKRLRRTVLVMMWLERRRARAVTVEHMAQMVRQAQLDVAKLFMLLMVLVARLGSMETLLLQLPNMLQRLLEEQFGALKRSFMGSMEDTIRSTVQTEMRERQSALLRKGVHDPHRQISEGFPETGGITRVKLRFVDVERPNDPLYTDHPVEWQIGKNAKVAIFENGRQIMQGDLSKLQIEVLPVYADFFTERGHADFTKEEFSKQIYTYKGKETALTTVNLRNGEAYIGSFCFTESSYRKRLRLTARVKRQNLAVRVQEAISDPFIVKVGRSKANEKSYPPSKEEPVHCLEKISPKGKHCQYLSDKNITTVKHLMRHYHRDKSGLQKLTDMKKDDWSTLVKHATTSDPGVEIYSYRAVEENTELLFNDFYDLVGMMIDGIYVPVNDLNQLRQLKASNWKMSAYKKFDERENSGDLTPDYFMSNGNPIRAELLNNDAGPSVQATMISRYANDMAAQEEFGEQHLFRQQNVFSPAQVLSNNDAGPSKQKAPLFSQQTAHQELCQHDPSMLQNGAPYNLTKGNILNDQGSFSANRTVPSHKFCPDVITGPSLIGQQNGYLSSWTADAPGSSYPVTDGVIQETSSLDHVEDDIFSGLIDEFLGVEEAHGADQDFIPYNNAQLPNSDNQFYGYEHNDADW